MVPRACLQPRDICVNFVGGRSLAAQAIALDRRTMLGPQLRIQSAETLRRLLAYLGATPSSWPTSTTTPIGDGVKALFRSRFSRGGRTCSGSTISGCRPVDRTQGNVARVCVLSDNRRPVELHPNEQVEMCGRRQKRDKRAPNSARTSAAPTHGRIVESASMRPTDPDMLLRSHTARRIPVMPPQGRLQ